MSVLNACEAGELAEIKEAAKFAKVVETSGGPAVLIGGYVVIVAGSPLPTHPTYESGFWPELIASLLRGEE